MPVTPRALTWESPRFLADLGDVLPEQPAECKWTTQLAPCIVFVPTAEVAAVRPGEELQTLVDASRTGLVVRVIAGAGKQTRVLQVRGSRLAKP